MRTHRSRGDWGYIIDYIVLGFSHVITHFNSDFQSVGICGLVVGMCQEITKCAQPEHLARAKYAQDKSFPVSQITYHAKVA